MRILNIIEKKRDGKELSKEEIDFFINQYVCDAIPDYQASALLMAIYFQGMTDKETIALTNAMLHSGDIIDLSTIKGIKVDKHSTGGVGDKTSLVLAPLVASMGVKFAKMSGRGLGHTGGTIDKLETIKGFNVSLDNERFTEQVNNYGLAIVGQKNNLTPADKKLYALRDVTGTVPSIPLIASSIMSKKLASGADAICLDVKVGSGAFMKSTQLAKQLARLMVKIGNECGKKMTAILTNMEEPLGYAVGNSLEVIEALNTLNGCGPSDLTELCLTIGSHLVYSAGMSKSLEHAKEQLTLNLNNGKAFSKFVEMVEHQGGDIGYLSNYQLFAVSNKKKCIYSPKAGFIHKIDALMVGQAACLLGAGRNTKDEQIDPSVGVILAHKVGDFVNADDLLATIYLNGKNECEALQMISNAFLIINEPCDTQLIIDIITDLEENYG